ncbi:MAG: tyrosine-type recombinase/integrase, partial [Actinobacteria bacterium]|nr:tyrosine-type recombinase/integrase [Actinomycetota bacterium]
FFFFFCLRHVRIHDLRHSFATLTLAEDVQLAAISQTLGHSSIDVTRSVYANDVPALTVVATSKLAEILDPDAPLLEAPEIRHRGLPFRAKSPGWGLGDG